MARRNCSCFHCGYTTSVKSNIRRHIISKHDPEKVPRKCLKNREYQCVLCRQFSSPNRETMYSHYDSVHDVKISPAVCHEFRDWGAFLAWKSSVEKLEVCEYVRRGSQTKEEFTRYYYRCHRDGHYKPRGKGVRRLKVKGSDKIDGCCPAAMMAKKSTGGSVSVKFTSTHVGHSQEINRLRLSKKDRESIAQQIAQKVPLDAILDDVRTSLTSGELRRIDLIKRQDLKNIIRDYNLKSGNVNSNHVESQFTRKEQTYELVSNSDNEHYNEPLLSKKANHTRTNKTTRHTRATANPDKKKQVLSMIHQALSLCTESQHFDVLFDAIKPAIFKLKALQFSIDAG